MMRPCEGIRQEGNKKVRVFSYVVTACEIGGDSVKAVRLDGFTSKYGQGFNQAMEEALPPDRWTIKGILKLYNSDFTGGEL